MGIHNEGAVVVPIVTGADDLYLDHLETLLDCCSTHVHIVIGILNIEHNELSKAITATECLELIFPVSVSINLVGSHCENINHLNEGGDLINKD